MREYLVTVYNHATYLARTLWLNIGWAAYSPRFEIQMKYQNSNEGLLAYHHYILRCSLVAQRLKCLPAMRETQVQSLGREDPLEKEIETCGERAPPLAKVMRKEAWHTQRRGSSLRSLPGNSRAIYPKTRVCLLSALCFHLHL